MIQLKSKDVKKVRKELLEAQGGICLGCGLEIHDGDACLDHAHKMRKHEQVGVNGVGMVRGVLCRGCNILLGKAENAYIRTGKSKDESDLPTILRGLADYLEQDCTEYIHPTEQQRPPRLMKSSYNELKKKVNGRQKIPEFTGNFTKALKKLFDKYEVEAKLKA